MSGFGIHGLAALGKNLNIERTFGLHSLRMKIDKGDQHFPINAKFDSSQFWFVWGTHQVGGLVAMPRLSDGSPKLDSTANRQIKCQHQSCRSTDHTVYMVSENHNSLLNPALGLRLRYKKLLKNGPLVPIEYTYPVIVSVQKMKHKNTLKVFL